MMHQHGAHALPRPAPAPNTRVATLHIPAPPAPMAVITANAWRSTVRPTPPRRPWLALATASIIAALLSVTAWTYTATPTAQATTTRAAR